VSNDYYTNANFPSPNTVGSSSLMQFELKKIEHAFEKLPSLEGAANRPVFVSADGKKLETRAMYSHDGAPVEIKYEQFLLGQLENTLDPRTLYMIPDWEERSTAIFFNETVYLLGSGAVRYDQDQTLTETEIEQAQKNLDVRCEDVLLVYQTAKA
jgi:hypothetical protein